MQITGADCRIAGDDGECRCSDITRGQWRQIGKEVAALGLNFNEISAANSRGRRRRGEEVMRGRMGEMRRALKEEQEEEEEEEVGLVPLVGERASRAWLPGESATGIRAILHR